MKRTTTTLAVIAAVAGTFAGSASAARFVDPAPSRLVLRASDVPRGYVPVPASSGRVTLAETARAVGGDWSRRLVRWGRVGGWATVFRTRDRTGRMLSSSVTIFRNATGARSAFEAGAPDYAERAGGRSLPSPPAVGETARAYGGTTRARRGGAQIRWFLVTWRDGRVVAALWLTGPRERTSRALADRLARRQDARMDAAFGRR